MAAKSGPLSVTELLEKQKAEAALKPRFLSKAERAKQAEQLQAQKDEQARKKQDADKQQRAHFEQLAAQQGATRHASDSRDQLDYGADSDHRRKARDPRPWHNGKPHHTNGASAVASSSRSTTEPAFADAQHAQIRAQYLGQKLENNKKAKRKPTDKKFVFDWGEEEDTATDSLALQYQVPTLPTSRTDDLGKQPLRGRFEEKHWSDKKLEEMKERDWRIFREDFGISARGGSIPRPLRSWTESSIPAPILAAIRDVGYSDPSPIQRQAIPIGLQNRDLIGVAETGSGKTASFLIPMLSYISALPKLDETTKALGPYALILVPTRELAQQIEGETNKFSSRLGLTSVSIVGGRDVNEQIYALRDGAEIIIATPGRLKDVLERHVLVLSQCSYVVMDEADKMVDMGFEATVNFILDSLPVSNLKPDSEELELATSGELVSPKYRVTMLYSATMPASVERMARTYLRRPATITIGDAGLAVATVEQQVEFVNSEETRKSRLIQILARSSHLVPIIVFVNQKRMADTVSRDLIRAGFPVSTLHSGKTQDMREEALESLRSGNAKVLVATDLAGRGIDVPNVGLVINFQMANNIESYVHRIGRTGRAGKLGTSITFLDQSDSDVFYDLRQEIAKSKLSKQNPALAKHPAAQHKPIRIDSAKRKRERDDQG